MSSLKPLPKHFYEPEDPTLIAKNLIGKKITTRINNKITSGIITECEAYWAPHDRASHAFQNRLTQRTQTMFAAPGTSYVYICYGIHHLFNIVTGPLNIPHAILLRSIQPLEGIDIMMKRRSFQKPLNTLTTGPGSAAKALGIDILHNGISLLDKDGPIIITEGIHCKSEDIQSTWRIGVESAGESAVLAYRYILKDNPFISAKSFTKKYLQAKKG